MADHEHESHHHAFKSPLVRNLFAALLVVLIVFVAAKAVNAVINFDAETQSAANNVITVSGEGKASAAPDVATISFTVSEDADTSQAAQDMAAKKVTAALAALKDFKIDQKDIKTSSYNISPRYSYPQPCDGVRPCVYNQEAKIIGYTASESVEVKVRNIDDAGKVVSALGGAGISNLYGPNFTIDDPDKVKAEARKEAIEKARAQAKELASALGVRIVRVANYSEGGSGYYPMAYSAKDSMAMGGTSAPARPEVELPQGENEVNVTVTITYEIR